MDLGCSRTGISSESPDTAEAPGIAALGNDCTGRAMLLIFREAEVLLSCAKEL